MAQTTNKDEKKEPAKTYKALRNAQIGSKKDGSPKIKIKKGEELKDLSPEKVNSYRQLNIIK